MAAKKIAEPLASPVPEGWPLDERGKPKDFDEMSATEAERCLGEFGSVDIESARGNALGAKRMDELFQGQTLTQTPWGLRDDAKYDVAMGHLASLSSTYLYLDQTYPEAGKIRAPNPQEVPTAKDLAGWLETNVWDGKKRVYSWLIRHGSKQAATGKISFAEDRAQQERYRRRLLEAPLIEPKAEQSPPLFPLASATMDRPSGSSGYLSPSEVEARIRAAQAEERQRMRAEMDAANERNRAEEDRRKMLEAITVLAREIQEIKAERLSSPPIESPSMRESLLESLREAKRTPLRVDPVEPPSNYPEPPEGYYLAWDFDRKRFYYAPKSKPTPTPVATPTPVLVPAPIPSAISPENPVHRISQAVREVVETTEEVKKAGTMLAKIIPGIGLKLHDELAIPPPPAPPLSDSLSTKEKSAFHEEGGMIFRKDRKGNPILDDLNGVDFLMNAGKVVEQLGALSSLVTKRQSDTIEEDRKRMELEAQKERLQAEIEAQKAINAKLRAEAERAQAEAIEAQQKALRLLESEGSGEGVVSSDHVSDVERSPDLRTSVGGCPVTSEDAALVREVRDLFFLFALALGFGLLMAAASCSPEQRLQAQTVLSAADKGAQVGCILVENLPIDQQAQDVCMTLDEIRAAIQEYREKQELQKKELQKESSQ